MLATLKVYLPLLTPKIVLWFYYEGNDLVDLQTERKSALLRNYLRDDFTQRDLARQSDIDRAITADMPRIASVEQENLERRAKSTFVNRLIALRQAHCPPRQVGASRRVGSAVDRNGRRLRDTQHGGLSRNPDPGEGASGGVERSALLRYFRNGPVIRAMTRGGRPNAVTC